METDKRTKSIRTIIGSLLQRYFGYGKKDLEKINIDDVDDPCFECLIFSNCHIECGEKAAHKILQYLNSPSIDPNSCVFSVVQNTITKELKIR